MKAFPSDQPLDGERTALARRALAAVLVVAPFVIAPRLTITAIVAGATALYLAALWYRMTRFSRGLRAGAVVRVSDEEALALPARSLPVYTVLVPAYREPGVLPALVESIRHLHYPPRRLDVKLVVEADDDETLAAIAAEHLPSHIEVVAVPPSEPRTKPKALNVALPSARGSIVTIFDAEDRPDPLQLRRAVVAFERAAPDVACFQARLSYYNPDQNLITRWFQAEYQQWFTHLLPGLSACGDVIPLGGTSNHIRTDVLRRLGGWDPGNVTEDADLGVRLYRAGHRVEVLDSTTEEEANSDFVNWARQRSRWYKGYLQTWLTHMRDPARLWRELGPSRFLGFNLFVGGTPLLVLVNPVFWVLTVLWFVSRPPFIHALFPAPLYYAALLSWGLGNAAVVYSGLVSARAARAPQLVPALLLAPLYWLMMSVAGIKALVQLVTAPQLWEKTVHGLDDPGEEHAVARL